MINRTTSITDANSETLAPVHNMTAIADTDTTTNNDSYRSNADDSNNEKHAATLATTPSQKIRLFFTKRTFTPVSYRNLLLSVRLLIFVLAFVALILDAITISFEVNVMGLDLSDISTQTALLLTPDLLAMMMTLFLVIRTSGTMCCCFGNVADLDSSYDSYDDYEGYEDSYEGCEDSYEGCEDGYGNEATIARRSFEEREFMPQTDQEFEEGQRHDFDQREREERLAQKKGKRVAFVDVPEDAHYTQHIRTHVVAATIPTDGEDIRDTLPYTHPPAALSIVANPMPRQSLPSPVLSEPSIPTVASKFRRYRYYYYIVFRVLFSLGLAVLALYWPARHMKVSIRYIPNTGHQPHLSGEAHYRGSNSTMGESSDYHISKSINYDLGNRHGTDIGSGSSFLHWCSMEEAFGDDQSALVYCHVKGIRPGLTYLWVVLMVIELFAAAMAGDFRRSGVEGDNTASVSRV